MSHSSPAVDGNADADVDSLFGLVDPSDDESSASSFASALSASTSPGTVSSPPNPHPQQTPAADPLDAHLQQTRAYHRKRRREEASDTAPPPSYPARHRASSPSAFAPDASTQLHPLFTAAKPPPLAATTRAPSASPSSPPSPPPPTASSSSSLPRLLSDDQLQRALNPDPFYWRQGVQDFDQVLSADKGRVAAYVDLTAVAESADYVRVPSFALGDGGVHGPNISDHSIHKARHEGYWEERLRRLAQQQPSPDIYGNLPTFAADPHNPTSTAAIAAAPSSSAASSPHPAIFAGCSMYIDGRTEGASELSAHSLTALIRLHGGHTSPLMSRIHTTHVIATNLTLSKHSKEMRQTAGMGRARGRMRVVRPEWVRECIRQGKLLDDWQFRVVKDVQQRELPWTTVDGDSTGMSKSTCDDTA